MTLRDLYIKQDEWLKAKFQDTYLWLLDRTGVYLATVISATYLASLAATTLRDGRVNWVLLAIVGICCAVLMFNYLLQDKQKFEIMNGSAMQFEASAFRRFANGYFIAMITMDTILMKPYDVTFDILLFSTGYWHTVKVRDRDKKPFFEKKEELSLQGAP